jgi:hypothetical protein
MNTRAEINAWLATATPEQVVDRLERAEREAFNWHIAMTCCAPTVAEPLRRSVEKMAENLVLGGYKRPEVQ